MTHFHQASFLASSNIYEVNLRQYTPEGTINAFIKHLPRLKDMGVHILWFMPIYPIGVKNRKGSLGSYYSIRDFCGVNPEFGTKKDFLELVKTAHEMGMKVILDWVANHAAWDNVWTLTNPEFFEQDDQGDFKSPNDWEDVIQINHHSEEEQRAMINAMIYWVNEFDIDGFRADLAHLTPLPFWIKARTHLTPHKKDLVWLAETEEIGYHQAFDISFTWKWMHITEQYCKGQQDFGALTSTLKDYGSHFPKEAIRMYFTSNHDENSWCGTEYEKYGIWAKTLAVFSCTWQGIPLVYSGQELPLKRRLDFFDKDEIEWSENIELHRFYKILFQLRKNNMALSCNKNSRPIMVLGSLGAHVLAFYRKVQDNVVLVFLNLSDSPVHYYFSDVGLNGTFRNVFTNEIVVFSEDGAIYIEKAGFAVMEKLVSSV